MGIQNTVNLFFISSLGQTYQVNNLIKNYLKPAECRAVLICYEDERSRRVEALMREHLESTYFSYIQTLRIPGFRSFKNLIRSEKIYRDLESGYKKLIAEADKVFVSNIDNHYFLLCSAVRRTGKSLLFYEEGFNSYRFLAKEYLGESETRGKRIIRRLVGVFCLQTASYRNVFLRGEENWFSDFSEVYAVFPDQLKDFLSADLWHDYSLSYDQNSENREILKAADYPPCDLLVLSQDYQQYITDAEFTRFFADWLSKNADEMRIVVKLHPRDLEERKHLFEAEFRKRGLNGIVLDNTEKNRFPAELLIPILNPKILLAIDSSTLLYGPAILPGVRPVSLIKKFVDKNPIFRRNLKILNRFTHVEIAE